MKALNEKHQRIVSQYDQEKSKHLERQANQLLKNDELHNKLRKYNVTEEIFDLFD